MANNKTKQVRDNLLALLMDQEPLSLELLYHGCGCDVETLAGAISSLIEKEEIGIGRYKTKPGWHIGEKNSQFQDNGFNWYTDKAQMRINLPKIIKDLRKLAPGEAPAPGDPDDEQHLSAVTGLLSDQKPRSKAQITTETGIDNIAPSVWRRLPQLPDGLYTVPDSAGAWEFLLAYLGEKPRRLQDLVRQFGRHKTIMKRITAQNQQEPLVRLPKAMITTSDSIEGKKHLETLQQLNRCRDTLESLSYPFFTPEDLGLSQEVLRPVAEHDTLSVEFNGNKYYSLKREFPGEVIVDQLGEISGRYFAPPHSASAPSFIKEHSLGVREAANLLALDEETMVQLIQSGQLEYFKLNNQVRLWRSDIEDLKRDVTKLRALTRDYEKLSVPEAAALLGISTGQVRILIDNGSLMPVSGYKTRKGTGYLLRRRDLEILKGNLPLVLSKNSSPEGRTRKTSFPPGEEKPASKKKPRRKKEASVYNEQNIVLDDFQIKANEALRRGLSVLVSAPTGNGKTLVAEMLARDLMAAGRGMVYTSPLKALSNQKYRDFSSVFGEEAVGLVTGDISINPDAPLLVMTTEIFRNWCLSEPDQLKKTSYVVFDEIHYLDDAERGTTWEESILFAPPHIKILGLSATVPNIVEMSDWISLVRGEHLVIVQESRRHVPLEILWILPNGRIVTEDEARTEVEDLSEYLKALRNRKRWIEE